MTIVSSDAGVNKCEGCYSSFSGWWCDNCDQWPCICGDEEEGEIMPTAVTPLPEEPRIAGIWVSREDNRVLIKHVDGPAVSIRCTESGLTAEAASSWDLDTHDWQPVSEQRKEGT